MATFESTTTLPLLPTEQTETETRTQDATLALSNNGHQYYRLPQFLKENPKILLALVLGSSVCIGIFAVTFWLSEQTLNCPDWANKPDCYVTYVGSEFIAHSGIYQGLASVFYGIGLTAMGYAVYAMAETAFWPIAHKTTFTLSQLDTYLASSRGSLLPSLIVLGWKPSLDTVIVVICVLISFLATTTSHAIIGYAYNQVNIARIYNSNHNFGGGTGLSFTQKYPGPIPLPAVTTSGYLKYTSWANSITSEPLPDYRDFMIQRVDLAKRGNMSIQAVRMKMEIDCTGTTLGHLTLLESEPTLLINATRSSSSSYYAILRYQPHLTVWVDSYHAEHAPRATATLIFASINGTIEGGDLTLLNVHPKVNVSAVACDIDVNLQNDTAHIGGNPAKLATTSSITSLKTPAGAALPSEDSFWVPGVSQLSLWVAVATTVMGVNIQGTQPMFQNGSVGLPISFETTADPNNPGEDWTLDEIRRFVNVSGGAILTSFTEYWTQGEVTIESRSYTQGLQKSRSFLLLLPVVLVLACHIMLVLYNDIAHRQAGLTVIQPVGMDKLVGSMMTDDMIEIARVHHKPQGRRRGHGFGDTKVRYRVYEDHTTGFERSTV
ncbi:hypothetical protein BD289DRAFT_371445 [Coniella lustricola]|uniref:Uncharacterized protein n=1 Tax=Coniella lustricola TaxID=2025994 RepID=A0A2T3A3N5_9PEZI|nr:hypothetical protein BD289DRAFT_371445 [Coniella lustricola]